VERPSARELLRLLKQAGKDNEYIIEVFVSIIQNKMQMGGDIANAINYQVEKLKREFYK
jgi:hypothetical protein